MTWDNKYRQLRKGEIVAAGDEILNDITLKWEPAKAIGRAAADPLCTAHSMFRRKKTREELEAEALDEWMDEFDRTARE